MFARQVTVSEKRETPNFLIHLRSLLAANSTRRALHRQANPRQWDG
jgi:hypothetical protein